MGGCAYDNAVGAGWGDQAARKKEVGERDEEGEDGEREGVTGIDTLKLYLTRSLASRYVA